MKDNSINLSNAAYNNADAAAYIGTTPPSLRLSRHTGKLYLGVSAPKFIKSGPRKVLYLKADLDDWLASQPRFENNAQVSARSKGDAKSMAEPLETVA